MRKEINLTEKWQLSLWVRACCEYVRWYAEKSVDPTVPLSVFLDPPVSDRIETIK
jgi:hypothetical protein